MPDTTVNYGFRIPKVDGSDYQNEDDLRVPFIAIDAQLKQMNDASAVIGCVLGKNSVQVIPGAVTTVVTWPYENFDTSALHDLVVNNSRITIPAGQGGKYRVSAKLQFRDTSPVSVSMILLINGLPVFAMNNGPVGVGGFIKGDEIVTVVPGDYLEVSINLGAASNLESNGVNYNPCIFSAIRIGA